MKVESGKWNGEALNEVKRVKVESGKLVSFWRGTTLLMLVLLVFFSCERQQDPIMGHWRVEKVTVDFDENRSTPEMVRQLGELEKGNKIDITKEGRLTFITHGDTLLASCSLRGDTLYCDGTPFARLTNGALVTEEETPLGKVTVRYTR